MTVDKIMIILPLHFFYVRLNLIIAAAKDVMFRDLKAEDIPSNRPI